MPLLDASKAQQKLYPAKVRDGGTHKVVNRMQVSIELYGAIGTHDSRGAGYVLQASFLNARAFGQFVKSDQS